MEDKVFMAKTKLYQVFKKFDKDNDGLVSGYVSYRFGGPLGILPQNPKTPKIRKIY